MAVGSQAVAPFSVALSATGPIEAESAQYFGGSPNLAKAPGVVIPASAIPVTDVVFTDLGATLAGGTQLRRKVYLYNPDSAPTQITATYFTSAGALSHTTDYRYAQTQTRRSRARVLRRRHQCRQEGRNHA